MKNYYSNGIIDSIGKIPDTINRTVEEETIIFHPYGYTFTLYTIYYTGSII